MSGLRSGDTWLALLLLAAGCHDAAPAPTTIAPPPCEWTCTIGAEIDVDSGVREDGGWRYSTRPIAADCATRCTR